MQLSLVGHSMARVGLIASLIASRFIESLDTAGELI